MASAGFTAEGTSYPAGTLVVRGARAVLERAAPAGADVRGLGPMLALEFPEQTPARASAAVAAARERGLVLLTCGLYGNVLRLHIPLTISDVELEAGLERLENALGDAGRGG
jgi:4-aminobutyrate aminotransferase-like enzyme